MCLSGCCQGEGFESAAEAMDSDVEVRTERPAVDLDLSDPESGKASGENGHTKMTAVKLGATMNVPAQAPPAPVGGKAPGFKVPGAEPADHQAQLSNLVAQLGPEKILQMLQGNQPLPRKASEVFQTPPPRSPLFSPPAAPKTSLPAQAAKVPMPKATVAPPAVATPAAFAPPAMPKAFVQNLPPPPPAPRDERTEVPKPESPDVPAADGQDGDDAELMNAAFDLSKKDWDP